jgi:hypothetical protein
LGYVSHKRLLGCLRSRSVPWHTLITLHVLRSRVHPQAHILALDLGVLLLGHPGHLLRRHPHILMGDTLRIHTHTTHATHSRLAGMYTDHLVEGSLIQPRLRHGPANALGTTRHHGVRISHTLQLVGTDSVHMGTLDGRCGKTLAILTGGERRIPSLLRDVVLVVHLGGSGIRRLRASHRESGIRIGGILQHGHVVGLGRRTRGLLALLEVLGAEHIVR